MGGVMRIRICIVLIGVAAVLADVDEPLSRQKRFAVQNCQITPDNTVDRVIEKGQTAKLTCNLDSSVQVFFIPGNAIKKVLEGKKMIFVNRINAKF